MPDRPDIEDTIAAINREGWFLINISQFGLGKPDIWTVAACHHSDAARFSIAEHCEGETLGDAVTAMLFNVRARNKFLAKTGSSNPVPKATTTASRTGFTGAETERLDRAFKNLFFAVKMSNGT